LTPDGQDDLMATMSHSLPDAVAAKLAAELGPLGGDVVRLDGGFTNRILRARFGGAEYVVRLAGKDTRALGIDRAAEREATAAAARVGIGPEVAAFLPDEDVLVTRYIEGRPLRADEVAEPGVLADVAESLKTLHRGPRLRAKFSPFRSVDTYRAIAEEHGVSVGERYEQARGLAAEIEERMVGVEHAPVLCHDDLLPANLIDDGERVRIVDWEYAGMGDRFFDLGSLSVHAGLDEGDDEWLLTAYWGEPPTARRFAALRLMRLIADFHEAMWGLVQSAIAPTSDFDYTGYGEEHFDRFAEGAADPQVRRWLADMVPPHERA
jgi:thiamine kinase-like enzyme